MKSPQVKYEEAVTRNLLSLKKLASAAKEVLNKHTLESLKIRTGIRATDTRFDGDLSDILATAKPSKAKEKEKVKADGAEASAQAQSDKAANGSPATKKSPSRADKIAARLKRPAAK